ncbi:efflux RND transporter periplasmic adaptor subunit [Sphingomonas montanisoli]|uniref:Efflux RND transporter periplasmic adaptor subunit n=1 Tax=Sphingomonas montanisoli TaxID=2606412 RepID=A0A5D9CD09_9SPHN|nr:efflux RND transporter periplasmic adaptor subunit [Sphingomonas montanisoli]TZG29549.1 efflux RND transporter periplasmic adaptor subunit [Sphingomonas montanisoli]
MKAGSEWKYAALLAATMLLSSCGKKDEQKRPTPEAGYIVVKTESVALPVELPGRTSAFETSEVRPQISGLIQARLFTEGSIVRAGETLYQIDPRLYRAALNQANANLANAQANREATATRAKRLEPLAKIEAVSQQDYTDASAAARQAAATVEQNRAGLETARINLGFTRVPAPITGRVGRSLFTTGALVTANQAEPLTTIQRLDPIFVDIQQSASEYLSLRRALTSGGTATPSSAAVKLKLEDGSEYPASGRLEFTEAMVDPATGTVTLRARFANPSGLLLPGMYVRATLSQATATNAILVPQRGLARDAKGDATVMLVGPDNKAVQKTVTAGRTIGDKWLVTQGLKPGDKLIVEGLGKIRPKQDIKPVPAGSPPAGGKKQGDRS